MYVYIYMYIHICIYTIVGAGGVPVACKSERFELCPGVGFRPFNCMWRLPQVWPWRISCLALTDAPGDSHDVRLFRRPNRANQHESGYSRVLICNRKESFKLS